MSFSDVLRGPARWPVLLVTALALAAAANFAIDRLVPPVYEASVLVLIPRTRPPLFPDADEPRAHRDDDERRRINNEVAKISSTMVLERAIAESLVDASPSLRASTSPVAYVRARLKVKPIPDTDIIDVSFESPSPEEAAVVVNVVTGVYLKVSRESDLAHHRQLRAGLIDYLSKLQDRKRQKIDEGEAAGLAAAVDRLRSERLASILIERAETDDAARQAELDGRAERLRALPSGHSETGKALARKAEIEAILREEGHVTRKLHNLEFSTSNEFITQPQTLARANPPTAPIRDLRWVGMGAATASILLAALAVGLQRGVPGGAKLDPVATPDREPAGRGPDASDPGRCG